MGQGNGVKVNGKTVRYIANNPSDRIKRGDFVTGKIVEKTSDALVKGYKSPAIIIDGKVLNEELESSNQVALSKIDDDNYLVYYIPTKSGFYTSSQWNYSLPPYANVVEDGTMNGEAYIGVASKNADGQYVCNNLIDFDATDEWQCAPRISKIEDGLFLMSRLYLKTKSSMEVQFKVIKISSGNYQNGALLNYNESGEWMGHQIVNFTKFDSTSRHYRDMFYYRETSYYSCPANVKIDVHDRNNIDIYHGIYRNDEDVYNVSTVYAYNWSGHCKISVPDDITQSSLTSISNGVQFGPDPHLTVFHHNNASPGTALSMGWWSYYEMIAVSFKVNGKNANRDVYEPLPVSRDMDGLMDYDHATDSASIYLGNVQGIDYSMFVYNGNGDAGKKYIRLLGVDADSNVVQDSLDKINIILPSIQTNDSTYESLSHLGQGLYFFKKISNELFLLVKNGSPGYPRQMWIVSNKNLGTSESVTSYYCEINFSSDRFSDVSEDFAVRSENIKVTPVMYQEASLDTASGSVIVRYKYAYIIEMVDEATGGTFDFIIKEYEALNHIGSQDYVPSSVLPSSFSDQTYEIKKLKVAADQTSAEEVLGVAKQGESGDGGKIKISRVNLTAPQYRYFMHEGQNEYEVYAARETCLGTVQN